MKRAIKLHPADTVCVVLVAVNAGEQFVLDGRILTAQENIDKAHKVAIENIAKDSPVYKYGEIIGIAMTDIESGGHVHNHNLDSEKIMR